MKKLTLTPKELSYIIKNKNEIGHGSNGLVIELNEHELFKFYYKDFINNFCVDKNNNIDLKRIGDISNTIEIKKKVNKTFPNNIESQRIKNIKSLISKQPKIKHSTLPLGFVYVNNFCVGHLLKYHKEMTTLYDYQTTHNLSEDEKKNILNKIEIAVNELLKNNIYLYDFTMHNILYNPIKKEIEIIDFEYSICDNKRNALMEKEMLERLQKIKDSFYPEHELY